MVLVDRLSTQKFCGRSNRASITNLSALLYSVYRLKEKFVNNSSTIEGVDDIEIISEYIVNDYSLI